MGKILPSFIQKIAIPCSMHGQAIIHRQPDAAVSAIAFLTILLLIMLTSSLLQRSITSSRHISSEPLFTFDTVADAYSIAVAGDHSDIRLREFQFTESAPVLDDGGVGSLITITGGFDKNYSDNSNSGHYSVMSGLTVKRGSVNLSNITIE